MELKAILEQIKTHEEVIKDLDRVLEITGSGGQLLMESSNLLVTQSCFLEPDSKGHLYHAVLAYRDERKDSLKRLLNMLQVKDGEQE